MAITGSINVSPSTAVTMINNAATANGWNIVASQEDFYLGGETRYHLMIKDTGNHYLIRFNSPYDDGGRVGVRLYYNNGSSVMQTYDSNSIRSGIYDVYICSHGILIDTHFADNKLVPVLITFDENGDAIMVGISDNSHTAVNAKCVRYADAAYQSCSYTANPANSTSLTNFVSKGSIGADSSCQYAYFMPLYQYSDAGIITMNGKNYITNGYWCIKD
jgi:hypothetical protein